MADDNKKNETVDQIFKAAHWFVDLLASEKEIYGNYKFTVELDGIEVAAFSDVSGISSEVELEEYKEGGLNSYAHQFVSNVKYPPIVLKRGLTYDDTLYKWYEDVTHGDISRKNGIISMKDYEGKVRWRCEFVKAYPFKWTSSDLNSNSPQLLVESLEIVHQGFTMVLKKDSSWDTLIKYGNKAYKSLKEKL